MLTNLIIRYAGWGIKEGNQNIFALAEILVNSIDLHYVFLWTDVLPKSLNGLQNL